MSYATKLSASARFLFAVAALFAVLACAAVAAAASTGAEQITIDYGGLTVRIDDSTVVLADANGSVVYPFTYEGRTYLPVRAMASALSCGVVWDDAKSEVKITTDGGGEPSFGVPRTATGYGTITVEYRNISITVDGRRVGLGTDEPFLFDDSVYVPFRAVAAALGRTIGFDDKDRAVLISGEDTVPGEGGAEDETERNAPANEPVDSDENESGDKAEPASFGVDDLAILIGDKRVALGQKATVFLTALGDGYYFEETLSCAYGGKDDSGADKMDKKYTYDGAAFSTLPIDGDVISAIDVDAAAMSGEALSTSRGVAVGDTLQDAILAYGDGYAYDADFGELTYWLGEASPKTPQLFFQIGANDIIEFISAYDGKSAG